MGIWTDRFLHSIILNTAVAINWNWKLAEPRVRRFKKQHSNTKSRSDLKAPIPIRKLVSFAIIAGLALSQWVVIIHPAHAPSLSINVQNFAFNPQNATIETGDSVSWTNNDPVIYTLWFINASTGSTYLLSQPMNPGTTWTHAFPDNIRLNYYDFDRLYVKGQLIIVPILRGDFGPSISFTKTITFGATVSGGTPPYKLFWTFGDGTNSTDSRPTHTYQSTGTYSVTLTVTDSSTPNAFTVTATHLLTVNPPGGGGGHLVPS